VQEGEVEEEGEEEGEKISSHLAQCSLVDRCKV
jgi:hypothetical protein